MNPRQRNSLLAAGIAAGVVSLPMTWMTIRNAEMQIEGGFGDMFNSAFQDMTINVTGLNGTLTFLFSTPLWFVIGFATAANVLQLMRSSELFAIPSFVLWLFAIVSLVWITIPILSALTSGKVTLGLGWFLGLFCAGAALASLLVPGDVESNERPSASASADLQDKLPGLSDSDDDS